MQMWYLFSKFCQDMSSSGCFSNAITALWFNVIMASLIMKKDKSSVASLVRGLNLDERCYHSFLNLFKSNSINLNTLIKTYYDWIIKKCNDSIYKINNSIVFFVDGKKVSKEGKKMPGLKSLHQDSENSGKAKFIMGHHFQFIGVVLGCQNLGFLFLPLTCLFAEKMKSGPNEKKTIFTRLIENLKLFGTLHGSYVVADAYYSVGKLILNLKKDGMKLITRVAHNAVAYKNIVSSDKNSVGRKKKYGEKIKLYDLFNTVQFSPIKVFLYGEYKMVEAYCINLIWKPVGITVRFVLVKMPNGKKLIFMSTDIMLTMIQIIEAYGMRFKIEVGIKVACQQIGTFMYHFWSKLMPKIKTGSGAHYTHMHDKKTKKELINKEISYEVFTQIATIVHGFIVYLCVYHKELVWRNFSEWYRTVSTKKHPTEGIAISALQESFWEFCESNKKSFDWVKLICKKQRVGRILVFFKRNIAFS